MIVTIMDDELDYSNTIIYKISCKDTNVTELYVGHTINFVQRQLAHKYHVEFRCYK